MKLVEQGRIDRDEPLATYLPQYRPQRGQMPSIRQLLLQTSGIPAWDDLPEFQDIESGPTDRFTRVRMLDVLARAPALYPAPVLRDLPVPADERARSAGNYDDGMFTFRVYEQGERLYVDVPPLGPPLRLRYQGAHEFATPEPGERRFQFEPAAGPVKRVDWEWGEIRAFGRRIR